MAKLSEKQKENKRKYNHQYDKENCKSMLLKFNKNTMADVIEWLETKESKQGYVIDLIKADMLANKK